MSSHFVLACVAMTWERRLSLKVSSGPVDFFSVPVVETWAPAPCYEISQQMLGRGLVASRLQPVAASEAES